jgi:predicted phosphodiesterase
MQMKIQIASDLHLEFLQPEQEKSLYQTFKGEADVLVLAGDIVPVKYMDQLRDVFGRFCELYEDVVYVPGNHEFYHTNPPDVENLLGALSNELANLHWLDCGARKIQGQTFYGGTGWFPNKPEVPRLRHTMNDFRLIKGLEPWVFEENTRFHRMARINVKPSTVVVSHHLPSFRSVPAEYKGDEGNCYFVNDMEWFIAEVQPKLWIHGHTHTPADYKIGNTRVVCNPLGYPGESVKYNPALILEI